MAQTIIQLSGIFRITVFIQKEEFYTLLQYTDISADHKQT